MVVLSSHLVPPKTGLAMQTPLCSVAAGEKKYEGKLVLIRLDLKPF